MRIQLLQTDIKWLSPDENRAGALEMIYDAPPADLIVLPETFTNGFCMKPDELAETSGDLTLRWMTAVAREKNAAVAGSVAAEESGKFYNRFFFVKPDGKYTAYDKRHLFSFSGEDKEFAAGKERVIVEYEGFRILLQVCYDLRFPVFSRNRGDYDLILYVANWPSVRMNAWNTLLRARAIENVCYVAGVNRVGKDPVCDYSGGTALIDFKGDIIAEAKNDKEQIVSGMIELEPLREFRSKFTALDDADDFIIK